MQECGTIIFGECELIRLKYLHLFQQSILGEKHYSMFFFVLPFHDLQLLSSEYTGVLDNWIYCPLTGRKHKKTTLSLVQFAVSSLQRLLTMASPLLRARHL
jgi:hypothetical protein